MDWFRRPATARAARKPDAQAETSNKIGSRHLTLKDDVSRLGRSESEAAPLCALNK